jgi:hypothetical protein
MLSSGMAMSARFGTNAIDRAVNFRGAEDMGDLIRKRNILRQIDGLEADRASIRRRSTIGDKNVRRSRLGRKSRQRKHEISTPEF